MTVNVNNDGGTPDPMPVATDFDGVDHHPYSKIEFGDDGTQTKVSATSGLPVDLVSTTIPAVVTRSHVIADADGAQTDMLLVAAGANERIVVTRLDVLVAGAVSADVSAVVGFGASTLPAPALAGADDLLLHAPGLKPGGGVAKGDGSGVLGIGPVDEDLRLTCSDPTGGSLTVTYSYYLTT